MCRAIRLSAAPVPAAAASSRSRRRPRPLGRTRPSVRAPTYSYRVRATDSAGNLGSYTPTASATTPAPDTQPPTGPASLAATAVSGGEIDLSWPAATDNVGVSGYQVERCTGCRLQQLRPGRDADRRPATRTRPSVRAPRTATGCARPTRPATSAAYTTDRVRHHTSRPPRGWWRRLGFDEGSGSAVADQSGNGNRDGANATWAAAGKFGKALQFNGTNSLVTVPTPPRCI